MSLVTVSGKLGAAFGHAALGKMVNKGTFFQRLKSRWGSGSGVRVEKPTAGKATAGKASAGKASGRSAANSATQSRAEPELIQPRSRRNGDGSASDGGAVSSTFQPADVRSSRKMSDREEAMLTVGHHFQELATLMRGSQAANDEKLQKIVEATGAISPALHLLLCALAAASKTPEAGDSTCYGKSRAATTSFYAHHIAAISAAAAVCLSCDQIDVEACARRRER